jgi:hypothetical protein
LCAGIVLPLRSEEPPSAAQPAAPQTKSSEKKAEKKSIPTPPPPPADSKKPSDLKNWDLSALPADAVIVVYERIADALRMAPDAVILTPAKYQEMREEIERLRKLLQTDKPATPTSCRLTGKVEENVVILEAVFSGSTDRPNTTVALACPQAGAAPARNENGVPHVRRTESGSFLAQIEEPGEYQIKLDLFVSLASRESNGRGFELTLPRATFTQLDLELPANSKDVSVGGRPLSDPELSGLTWKGHHLSGVPSTRFVEKLDVAWKEVRPPSGVAVLTAKGDIQVRLDPSGLTTEAALTLSSDGAPAKDWRLLTPVGAEVKVEPPDDLRIKSTIETDKQKYKFAWLRTIHLKEPSAEPLHVHIKTHAPAPRGGAAVPVGPFFVLGAARQTGTVVVKNHLRNLHLYYHVHGDMTQRQVGEEGTGDTTAEVATFTYGDIPLVDKAKEATGAASLSWLDLEAETVRGQVRTRVVHTLTLRPDSTGESLHWDILTTITPVSRWPEGEQLKVLVPSEWTASDDGIQVGTDKNTRSVTYNANVLRREGPTQPQQLPGRYNLSCQVEGHAALQLPQPQGLIEQCEVKIKTPAESEVLLHNAAQADLDLIQQPRPNEQTWRCRHVLPPDWPGLDVSWRPYRPEVPATSLVDLDLNGDRANIRHEIRFQLPQMPPASFNLRLPEALGDTPPRIVESDNKLQPARDASSASKGVLRFTVAAGAGGTECRLVLEYAMKLVGDNGRPPGPGEHFTVPLVVPERTHGAIRVRVWSGPDSLPRPTPDSAWEERSIEEVKGRQDLPVLVLQAPRGDASLVLRRDEPSSVFTVLVERVLMRVQLLEDGGQLYRASFQIRQLADRQLDIKLPGPVTTLNVRIALNHHRVTPTLVNEQGQRSDGGNIARLDLGADLIRQLALLEVSYQLPPGRGVGDPLRSTLQPPQLRDAPPLVPTRWLVGLPSHRVLIAPENTDGLERTWTRRGWLLAAQLNCTSADLEREFEKWLPDLRQGDRIDAEASWTPALACWQESVGPLTLTHAPQQAWLLVCSLALLILGLGLYWTARPQPGDGGRMALWLWPILALVTLGVVTGVLFWPTTLWAVVYGCQPGALVLLGAIAFQWLMHQRYRRQIVFLPSFSRGKAGSSLLRKSAPPRPRSGEPSTIDAPPPAG